MMRILITVLLFWKSIAVFGQAIPYELVKTIDDCMKELRQVEGFYAQVVIKHADPKDNRDFQVSLENSRGREQLKINKDGTFRLPAVKADEARTTQVIHSLEKGALRLDINFGFWDKLGNAGQTNFFEVCTLAANKAASMEHVFVRLGDVFPPFKDLQIAFVGVSLVIDTPCSGLAILKNGEKTVTSIDLSQTGKVSWMFADYDPRTHRIVFELGNCAAKPRVIYEIRTDREAAKSKGAILALQRR
jgi:hypothetical protein